jgi:phage terminase large subunit-like protein
MLCSPSVVDIRDFIGLLKHSRGDFAGKPFVLERWQDEYLDKLFNTKKADGLRQYRTSLLALPRKNGKALALDTPVLTTTGWSTMGDLNVGDHVFHPNGYPVRVIAATEVMHGRPCYGVKFRKGETIVADAEHLWKTVAYNGGPGGGRGFRHADRGGEAIRTTRTIAKSCTLSGRKQANHSIPVGGAIQLPAKSLPIDPYVFGLWLGDGSKTQPMIAVGAGDEQTISNIEDCGYDTRVTRRVTQGRPNNVVSLAGQLTPDGRRVVDHLRSLGVFGNKHVPREYIESSVEQRLSLLQGLMDSDGYASESGLCVFVNNNKAIVDGLAEVVRSLGMKAYVTAKKSTSAGKDYGIIYQVVFTAWHPTRIFRLSRKQERIKPRPEKRSKTGFHYIAECQPTDSVPVRCIQVDSPDGMFLVGRSLIPTHNSALCAAIGIYMMCCDDEGAEVIVAAGDRAQASLLHTAAKQFVEGCPSLMKRCRIYRNSIVFPEKNSTMLCISSESATKHGYNPSCCLIDEMHVFPDRELIDVLETGMGARSQPLTIYITTAGTDMDGPCYKDWQRALKIRDGVLKDDSFLPCIYAADPEDDPFIEETWKKANPNYGITLKPDYFRQFSEKAKSSPTDEVVFRTLHLNQWQKSETKWIRHGAWDANNVPLRPTAGRPCWCGVDLASTFDTTAFVAIWPDADGTYDVHAHFFIPEENAHRRAKEDRVPYHAWADAGFVTLTDGDITDYDAVRDYILSFAEKNAVRGIAIDRWNAVHLTTQLVSEGIDVKPFGQGFASMSAPSKLLETLTISRRLRHAGNPVLAWQMSNVQVKIDDAGNIKPTKKHSHSTARIDGAVSLIMALGISSSENHGNTDEPTLMVL